MLGFAPPKVGKVDLAVAWLLELSPDFPKVNMPLLLLEACGCCELLLKLKVLEDPVLAFGATAAVGALGFELPKANPEDLLESVLKLKVELLEAAVVVAAAAGALEPNVNNPDPVEEVFASAGLAAPKEKTSSFLG